MLQRLRIENWKCLRSVSTTFQPLTLLIGPNDSGKTSFLQAIDFLRRLASDADLLDSPASLLSLFTGRDPSNTLRLEVDLHLPSSSPPYGRYNFAYFPTQRIVAPILFESLLSSSSSPPSNGAFSDVLAGVQLRRQPRSEQSALAPGACAHTPPPFLDEVAAYFRSFRMFQFRSEVMSQAGEIEAVGTQSVPELGRYGGGLVDLLDWILTEHRRKFLDLEKAFCEICGTIEQINLPRHELGPGKLGRRLEFVSSPSQAKVDASMISEGHLMLLGYLTLLYHPKRPRLLMLEEPESHLHPARLAFLFQLLRQISEGFLGLEPCQVILTTHNPQLLNYAKPEEVRIFYRDPETRDISIHSMEEAKDLHKMLKLMNLGEIWHNVGEADLVRPS